MSQSVGEIHTKPTPSELCTRSLVHLRRDNTCSGNNHGRRLSGMYIPPHSKVVFGYLALFELERLHQCSPVSCTCQCENCLTLVTSLWYPNSTPPVSIRIRSELPSTRSVPVPWGSAALSCPKSARDEVRRHMTHPRRAPTPISRLIQRPPMLCRSSASPQTLAYRSAYVPGRRGLRGP